MWISVRGPLYASLGILVLAQSGAALAGHALAAADRAFELRAEKVDGDVASSRNICEAITRLEQTLARDQGNLEASWKLLRALFYRGQYTGLGEEERQSLYRDAVVRVEESLDRLHRGGMAVTKSAEDLAAEVRGQPDAVALHFWAAVHWGLWGEMQGALPAVRKGVAKRVRRHAQVAIELDERYENGGGARALGRLHAVAPRVPLITGWVSRERAVVLLDRAMAVAPDDFFNRLYLGQALIELSSERGAEGVQILRRLVEEKPRPESLLEDRFAQRQARAFLDGRDRRKK